MCFSYSFKSTSMKGRKECVAPVLHETELNFFLKKVVLPLTNKARCLRTPDLQAKERDKCTVEISTLSVRACLATEWLVLFNLVVLSYLQKTKSRPEQAIAKGCKFIRTLKHLRVHCSRGQNVHAGEMMQNLNVKKVSLLESTLCR